VGFIQDMLWSLVLNSDQKLILETIFEKLRLRTMYENKASLFAICAENINPYQQIII
jgi:hypothetical protein